MVIKNYILKILEKNIFEHLFFILLGILAIVFYNERLYADSGYYIFKVINNENFWVEHNRYILILSQLFPLIAVKLGFGLKAVLYIYSVGHVFFFYCIFLISRYIYKDKYAGLLLILIQTLGIMSGFFVPMFELYYSTALLILFISILYHSNIRKNFIILLILTFFILTAHLYSFILFLFILVLHAEEFKFKHIKLYIFFLLMMTGLFILKKYTASEYEQAKANDFISTLKNGVYNFDYIKSLSAFIWEYYKELLFIEIITIGILLFSKEFLKSFLIGVAFIGTLAMINISAYGFEHTRYQEQVYFPLSFVAAYPFLFYVIKNKNIFIKIIFSFVVFIIIVFRINGITTDSEKFTGRVEEMKSLIEKARQNGCCKYIVHESSLIFDSNWSYPIETMLLSSSDNENSVTICTKEDIDFNQNRTTLTPNKYLFRKWDIYYITSLNKNYFKLENSEYKDFN